MKKPLAAGHPMKPANLPRSCNGFGKRLRLVVGIGINAAGAAALFVETLRHSGLSI